jgi:hypothetical protein
LKVALLGKIQLLLMEDKDGRERGTEIETALQIARIFSNFMTLEVFVKANDELVEIWLKF